jgi:hypothetical protein
MESNEILIKLERRNFYLRLTIILVLILIALLVVYFRYGYTDPDDVGIIDKIGRNVSCREALNYYAEHKWGYTDNQEPDLSLMNISVPFS